MQHNATPKRLINCISTFGTKHGCPFVRVGQIQGGFVFGGSLGRHVAVRANKWLQVWFDCRVSNYLLHVINICLVGICSPGTFVEIIGKEMPLLFVEPLCAHAAAVNKDTTAE
jgi:hypothetical protein